jgi:HTH-type transcriptional regulator, sugar sensing transcriptional regulator
MAIERVLTDIGLHETEVRFYLAALELGQAAMRDIARKAGISRTNAYDVFSRLLEQRLVNEIPQSNDRSSMLIVAESPARVLEKLEAVMPELMSLHNRTPEKPKVRYFQGSDGIKAVLDETITCRSKTLLGILSMSDLYEVPGRAWMDDNVRRRIEAGVTLRVLRSATKDLHKFWSDSPADLRILRYAPENFSFSMTTYIYDDTVALISSRKENFAMTIESAEFAAMQTGLFETLWAASSPQEPSARRSIRGKVVDLHSKK